MASISSAMSFAGTTTVAAVPGGTVTSPTAAPGAPVESSVSGTSDGFMQLLVDMLNGDAAPADGGASLSPQELATPADSSAPLSLQELAALALGSEPVESGEAADSDTDTDTDPDSAESEEAGALAMAALLPGLCLAPAQNGAVTSADVTPADRGTDAALAVTMNASQAAIESLADDGTNAAGNAPTPATDSTAANGSQGASSSAQMHALMAAHRAPDVDAVPDGMIRAPVGSSQFKDELGAQLTLMALNGRETASLRLSPEHLGPLEIRISMREGEASVWFGAANADTRSALEQSMPKLREMFASQGLVLADAGVSRDPSRNSFKPAPFTGGTRGSSDAGSEQSVTAVTLRRMGLIDTYV